MKVVIREKPKLYDVKKVQPFLEISPSDPQGWEKSIKNLSGRSLLRKELADVLLSYNESLGNDNLALENIRKLENEVCVFTGQQLGMMGGPAYTILKAVTCLQLAKEYGAIPIFWLATEDHDIDEINHTYLIDALGNLKKYHLKFPKDGKPVEELEVDSAQLKIIEQFCKAVAQIGIFESVKEESSYSRMMARVLVELFRGTGLVFVEPKILRQHATAFFRKEIVEAAEMASVISNAGQDLTAIGESPSFPHHEGTNLFYINEEKHRKRIIKKDGQFLIGKKSYSQNELLDLLEQFPERFSGNAAARPVMQSALFPVAAYVAGPGELNYYRQLKEYHYIHQIKMPWIVPRISATMITPEAQIFLEKCDLKPWDKIPLRWEEMMPNIEHLSETLEEKAIPSHALHYLRNFLHPHKKLQERLFSWWEFQSRSEENLVQELLKKADWRATGHHYCYL